MRIKESIGRGILRALRSQFASPYEAVREIIDNALDHRQGQHVEIDVTFNGSTLAVQNIGGRGMGPEQIRDFVSWGAPADREDGAIGYYSQGGKAACMYLGTGFNLTAKRAGDHQFFVLSDPDLRDRLEPRDYGDLRALAEEDRVDLPRVAAEMGYVRLEVLGLDATLNISEEGLKHDLSAAYSPLLFNESVSIRLNGNGVRPRIVLLDDEVACETIRVRLDHVKADGFVGKVQRGANRPAPRPGFSVYWRGRLVQEGVWFSANPYAKGSLAGLYGELTVEGLMPNLNKSGFVEEGSHLWSLLGEEVIQQAAPVLEALRSPNDGTRITLRDRRLARQTRQELQGILDRLLSRGTILIEEERTIRITRGGGTSPAGGRGGRPSGSKEPANKGEREREEREADGLVLPEIIVDAWGAPVRAETRRLPNGSFLIAVNKAHPSYGVANARYAIAESVIVEALRASGGLTGIDEYVTEVDAVLAEWATNHVRSEDETL